MPGDVQHSLCMPAPAPNDRPSRASAVEHVVDAIVEGVKTGRYVAGQRLIEADLTTDLGVSRGPLREALSRLASQGLLEIEPHRGAVVRRLTKRDVEELFALRELLEGEAARLAATRIDEPGVRATFRAFAKRLKSFEKSGDAVQYTEENTAFHAAVMEASGNDLLARVSSQLATQAFRLQFRNLVEGRFLPESIEDHAAIIDALLAGDGREAEKVMRRHVRRSAERALALPDSMFG
jgi:DNA-binding GntR family transcriptional regulator